MKSILLTLPVIAFGESKLLYLPCRWFAIFSRPSSPEAVANFECNNNRAVQCLEILDGTKND